MKNLIPLLLIVVLVSCKQDKVPEYPHCFANLTATHQAYSDFGGTSLYVSITDTSTIVFNLDDRRLGIGATCMEIEPSDFDSWSSVTYMEWSLHPDSIPPDFSNDVWQSNTSTVKSWSISEGSITAIVSDLPENREINKPFNMSFQLRGGVFNRSQNGLSNIEIDNIVVRDATVMDWGPE
ncbi:MAG: hypothetical protein Crog4KO_17450 [Crocinitomicaceae bacterium]